MNYHNITHDDMNNGDGLRVVLQVSGCSHYCYNCQNRQTWNPDSGIPFDESAKQEIFNELSKNYISGSTFSGGDPLYEGNLKEILQFIKEIKETFTNKTIWLYTGYTLDDIRDGVGYDENGPFFFLQSDKLRYEIISNVDVLVYGEYVDTKRDVSLKWRGSSNQRVIDVQRSLDSGRVILWTN